VTAVEERQTNDRATPDAAHEPDTTSDAASHARRRRLKIAVITGVLAFVIVAAVLTASELLAGESLTGDGRTTLFDRGGDRERAPQPEPMQTTPSPTAETTPTPITTTPTPTAKTPGP